MTRWSQWLRLDSEDWSIEIIAEPYLGELEVIARDAKAARERRATPAEMGEIFKRLAVACRGQPGEGHERAATMALYLRYLADYPTDVLSKAADAWITTRVFMPAISEIRALCEAEVIKLERAWHRAEALVGRSRGAHEARRHEEVRKREIAEANAKMTPERWAEIQAKVRGLSGVEQRDEAREQARASLAKNREKVNARIPPNEAA